MPSAWARSCAFIFYSQPERYTCNQKAALEKKVSIDMLLELVVNIFYLFGLRDVIGIYAKLTGHVTGDVCFC